MNSGHRKLRLTMDVPVEMLEKFDDFTGNRKKGITVESIAAEICREHPADLGYIYWSLDEPVGDSE